MVPSHYNIDSDDCETVLRVNRFKFGDTKVQELATHELDDDDVNLGGLIETMVESVEKISVSELPTPEKIFLSRMDETTASAVEGEPTPSKKMVENFEKYFGRNDCLNESGAIGKMSDAADKLVQNVTDMKAVVKEEIILPTPDINVHPQDISGNADLSLLRCTSTPDMPPNKLRKIRPSDNVHVSWLKMSILIYFDVCPYRLNHLFHILLAVASVQLRKFR